MRFNILSSNASEPRYSTDYGVECEGSFTMDMSDDMELDKERGIELSMFFGRAIIEIQGRRYNFGDTQKIESLWVEMND